MSYKKSKVFPLILAIVFIVVVIYLFANIEQTVVKCSKKTTDELGIIFKEELTTSLEGKKISKLDLTRTIILPSKYLNDNNLDYLENSLKKSYEYLEKDKVKISKLTDRLIVYVTATDEDTLILNNIDFIDDGNLVVKINSNTKSSDVVTLKVKDNYTQGSLITHMKVNGYSCG